MPQFKHYRQRNVQPGGRQGALIDAHIAEAFGRHRLKRVRSLLYFILGLQVVNTSLAAFAYYPEQIKGAFAWMGARLDCAYSFYVNWFIAHW